MGVSDNLVFVAMSVHTFACIQDIEWWLRRMQCSQSVTSKRSIFCGHNAILMQITELLLSFFRQDQTQSRRNEFIILFNTFGIYVLNNVFISALYRDSFMETKSVQARYFAHTTYSEMLTFSRELSWAVMWLGVMQCCL